MRKPSRILTFSHNYTPARFQAQKKCASGKSFTDFLQGLHDHLIPYCRPPNTMLVSLSPNESLQEEQPNKEFTEPYITRYFSQS
jgi:hypothetical protein